MNKEERKRKILASITSFNKEKYTKEELINECTKFEKEIVRLTFNEQHADLYKLKLCNVFQHFEHLNAEKNYLYTEQLNRFKSINAEVINMIKKYKSGSTGEFYAVKSLKTISCPKIIKNNIELSKDEFTTEIDSLVITEKGIYIIEVKNTRKDILIDEYGNYIRLGDVDSFDCQIGEKMNHKEYLIREALFDIGLDIRIKSLVVFTNYEINVTNKYKYIQHCFLSDLPHIIELDELPKIYSQSEMKKIALSILDQEVKKEYSLEFDIAEFKDAFATLMSDLECEVNLNIINKKEKENIFRNETKKEKQNNNFWENVCYFAGGVLATVVTNLVINYNKRSKQWKIK